MDKLTPIPGLQNAVRLVPSRSKRWRCYHCNAPKGVEFTGPAPHCPSCKRTNSPIIIELTDVHWHGTIPDGAMPGEWPNERKGIACMPKRPTVAGLSATGVLEAVTCPACLESKAYKDAWRAYAEVWPDYANHHEESKVPQLQGV